MTSFSVCRNAAASAPMMMRWSAVRETVITLRTPIMPSAVATTVGLEEATARMAPVPCAGRKREMGRGQNRQLMCMCGP